MREIVIDTETTGLSYKTGDRIIEVGCVELINHVATNNSLQFYCKADKVISEGAKRTHGITDGFLSDKKYFNDHCDEFLRFIDNDPLIIHNADFDVGFINNELSLLGKKKLTNQVIDTLTLARDKFPGSPISLDALCKRYRIDNSKRVQHTALIDCELLSKVYINLIDQKEPLLDFKNTDNEKNDLYFIKNHEYCKKIIKASLDEINLHKTYLKNNLKKNYF